MDTIHQILSWAGMTGIILAVVISAYLAFVRHEHTSDISVRLNGILMALSTVLFVAGRLHGTSRSATVLWWIAIALVAVSIALLVIAACRPSGNGSTTTLIRILFVLYIVAMAVLLFSLL